MTTMTEPDLATPAGEPRVAPFGDAAVLITLGDTIDLAINRAVHRLAGAIREATVGLPGYGAPIPTYASLIVPVDPLQPGVEAAAERLLDLVRAAGVGAEAEARATAGRDSLAPSIEIPVRYGGQDGPDLAEVAAASGLSEAEVVARHAAEVYDVFFVGFAPGFAYLGIVPEAIAVPRRPTPRSRVPAGSVGIAGRQTGIYPSDLPGGWQLIGRTTEVLWDPSRDPPTRLRPGDRVRFVPER